MWTFKNNTATKTKTCEITKEKYSVSMPIDLYYAWNDGALIQEILTHYTDEQREFLISDTTPEEWNAMEFEEE